MRPRDPQCGRSPAEIPYIVELSLVQGVTPDEWVLENEGTLNPENLHFACDECYIVLGTPALLVPERWVMP